MFPLICKRFLSTSDYFLYLLKYVNHFLLFQIISSFLPRHINRPLCWWYSLLPYGLPKSFNTSLGFCCTLKSLPYRWLRVSWSYIWRKLPHTSSTYYEPIEGLGVLKEPLARRLPLSGVNKRGQSKKRGVALAWVQVAKRIYRVSLVQEIGDGLTIL